MAGRKPHPSRLKVLKGTNRPSRENKNEPQPALGRPVPLPGLSQEALEHFYQLAEQLQQIGVLTVIDGAELSLLSQSMADYEESLREIAKRGKLYVTKSGNVIQSPWMQIRNKAVEQIIKLAPNFGLNPSSRSRLHVNPPGPTDPEEDRFFG